MSRADYLTGVAFFALTVGPVLASALLVARRRLSHLEGAARALSVAVLTVAGLLLVHLVPGLVGILSREAAAIGALLLLGACVAVCRDRPAPAGTRLPALPGATIDRLSLAVAAAGVGVAAAWSAGAAWFGTVAPSTDVDTLTFHLPNVLKWVQSGSVWRTDQFIPLLANGNYPHNGDVVMLTALLPWENDTFVRAAGLPFAALTGLAIYAIGREAEAPPGTSALMGATFAALPVYVLATFEGAKTDSIMLAMFAAGTYFLVRSLRDSRRSSLVLGALGLGIAFGTKWYGLWSVGVVVLVWGGTWLYLRRGVRDMVRAGGWVVGIVLRPVGSGCSATRSSPGARCIRAP